MDESPENPARDEAPLKLLQGLRRTPDAGEYRVAMLQIAFYKIESQGVGAACAGD